MGQGHQKKTYRDNLPRPTDLTETKPPTKEHSGLDVGSLHIYRDMQHDLHVDPLTTGTGLSLTQFPTTRFLLLPGLPGWVSAKEDVPSPAGTRCPEWGGTQGSLPLL